MFAFMSPKQAIALIKDGDCIGINSFLALSNPETLHDALTRRIRETNTPKNLRIFCSAGFGGWDENRFAEPYIAMGAVSEVVGGHFSSMPVTLKLALEGQLAAYNLPLGVLSHSIRAAASGHNGLLSKIGLNLFVDPRVDTPALNSKSDRKLVELVEISGEEFLYYQTPKVDVSFIKGTTVDPNGNITFENEYLTVDALSLAQATKANGGIVIVQVDKVSHMFARPRNVIIPGVLVDAVVVSEVDTSAYQPSMTGDIHVPPSQMDYYMGKLATTRKKANEDDFSPDIIGKRAALELREGQVINIGIGIPEQVGKYAAKLGMLRNVTMTVESGGIGGLPAPGLSFGATIGADMICDMASQFDFYDGGGLDICFMGGLECDRHGNVNAHKLANQFVGIGGFANITAATKIVVFCMTFATKGLTTRQEQDGRVSILNEGAIFKFKKEINAISFSAKNALQRGQRVLYVTERCVFELTPDGIKLKEVYDGIDVDRDIRAKLDFAL